MNDSKIAKLVGFRSVNSHMRAVTKVASGLFVRHRCRLESEENWAHLAPPPRVWRILGEFRVGPERGCGQSTRRGGIAAMPKMKLPKVCERVTVEGHEGVFFVLGVDPEPRTVSLLPSSDGPILKNISVDTLKLLPAAKA